MRPVVLLVSLCVVLLASTLPAAELLQDKIATITRPGEEPFEALNVAFKRITDSQLATLPVRRKVEYLNLSGTQITNEGVRQLVQKFPNLEVLYLSKTEVNDAGLAHLSRLPHLRSLYLRECASVTNTGLAHLKDLPLGQLDIQATKVTDEGLEHVANWWPKLGWLAVGNGLGPYITDTGMAHIAKCQQLVVLDLAEAQVTNEGLAEVIKLRNLRRLTVPRFTDIDDAGIAQLKDLPNLRALDANGAHVTRSGLLKLQQFPMLLEVKVGKSNKYPRAAFTNAELQALYRHLKENRARLQVAVPVEAETSTEE